MVLNKAQLAAKIQAENELKEIIRLKTTPTLILAVEAIRKAKQLECLGLDATNEKFMYEKHISDYKKSKVYTPTVIQGVIDKLNKFGENLSYHSIF